MRGKPAGTRVLAGVSGGPDSTALLAGLLELGFKNLIVVHVNHRLRGRRSGGDARAVAALARRHDLHLHSESVDTRAFARAHGVSIELAARDLRHAVFASAARTHRTRTVVLGHHADDRAETAAFNFLRGSGPRGLCGMRVESTIRVKRLSLLIVRPMLAIRRPLIEEYLVERDLAFRTDHSNELPVHTRNRIRLELLPLAKHILGADCTDAINRAAEIFADENDYMETVAAAIPVSRRMPLKTLADVPPAIQRRVLRNWLALHKLHSPQFAEIERIRGILDPSAPCAKVNLCRGKHVRRTAGCLHIE